MPDFSLTDPSVASVSSARSHTGTAPLPGVAAPVVPQTPPLADVAGSPAAVPPTPPVETLAASAGAGSRASAPILTSDAGDSVPWSQTWATFAAKVRSLSQRASSRLHRRTLKIGISARIFHPEPGAKGLRGKNLQYLEESIAHWVMSRDVLVFMIPTVNTNGLIHPSNIRLRDYAKNLDGLVLQGGADVSPQSYAEAATRPEWEGDRARDMYELELLHEFIEADKPVLGICRGCQLINVAFGGTLYQDLATELPHAQEHVNDHYDRHRHPIQFPPGSTLARLLGAQPALLVNSIHHQAVKDVGRDMRVEAISGDDQVVEAISYRKARFVVGLQWHPEFHRAGGSELLDCTPILDAFLRAARETRF